jgi:hypothetical protein
VIKKRLFIAAVIASLVSLVPAGSAYAGGGSGPDLSSTSVETDESTAMGAADTSEAYEGIAWVYDSTCTSDLQKQGLCSTMITVEMSADAQAVATAAQIAADGALVNSEGVTLADAAAVNTAPIYTRTWSELVRGLFYFNWWEKHEGRIYFQPGVVGGVWSTTSRYGYKGWHHCGLGGGIGYTVSVTYCYTERRYDLSWYPISEWDKFKVHVLWHGIPIYQSHSIHINAYPGGAIYFH